MGYTSQLWIKKYKPEADIKKIRKWIQQIILLALVPPTIVFSVWIAPLKQVEIIYIPLLGAIAPLFGGMAAYVAAKLMKLNREKRGILTVSGIFTNMGSLGGLTAFMLLGEKGFALVAIYQLFEKFIYFMIGFPVAKRHSSHKDDEADKKNILIVVVKDPVIIMNITALILGIILNFSGIVRPNFLGLFNAIVVPFFSLGLLTSIGLAMSFGSMHHHLKAAGVIIIIKSILTPLLITGLGILLGLGNFADGLGLKMVFILSAMPVGFLAVVPATLYDMEVDQANTCWLMSTLSLVLVIPALQFLLPYIG
ncbi:MAG: hypothetical protein JEY99_02310 [Spirochaetales bacterium]|nr:hypothetical protein [Spirochaetales bacterium]